MMTRCWHPKCSIECGPHRTLVSFGGNKVGKILSTILVLLTVVGMASADALPTTTITYTSLASTFNPVDYIYVPTTYGSIQTLSVTNANNCYWNAGASGFYYGDLNDSVYNCDNATNMAITFTPENGTAWTLDSFDLAAYSGDAPGDNYVVTLTDGSGNVLWTSGTVLAPSSGHLTLTPDVTFTSAVTLNAGTNWNVALSNLHLTDPVPEPASLFLVASGLMAVWFRRK